MRLCKYHRGNKKLKFSLPEMAMNNNETFHTGALISYYPENSKGAQTQKNLHIFHNDA